MIEPMPPGLVAERYKRLESLLKKLAEAGILEEEDRSLDNYVSELTEIYSDEYRQMYSQLYPILIDISDGDPYILEPLVMNLETLKYHIKDLHEKKECEKYLYGSLLKLSDHLNLEVQRLSDSTHLEERLEDIKESSDNMEMILTKTRRKIGKMQTEVVMVLAIFAAIVMAFSGGLTILGGALAGMTSAGPHFSVLIVMLCGLVLFNTVGFLMYAVNRIVDDFHTSIDNHSKEYNISLGGHNIRFCPSGERYDLRVFVAVNVVFILLIFIDLISWTYF